MSASFSIHDQAIPPRPNFPISCNPIIETVSQTIEGLLSGLFDPLERLTTQRFRVDSLDQVRSYFEVIDTEIRAAYLKIEILRNCLKRAEDRYVRLNESRRRDWLDFREQEKPSQRWTQLPLEVVSYICALDYNRLSSDTIDCAFYSRPHALQSSFARWGDLCLDGAHFPSHRVSSNNPLLAKARRLVLLEDENTSVASACATTDKWVGLRATEYFGASGGPEHLFKLIDEAQSIVPHLEVLLVPFGYNFREYLITTTPEGAHTCTACTDALVAPHRSMPRCREAHVPLAFLPYIGPLLTNLVHLTITLPNILDRGFGSHFHHISLQRLQTLRVFGQTLTEEDKLGAGYFSQGLMLETPALTCIILLSLRHDGDAVTSLLKQVNCSRLESLFLSDPFVLSQAPYDDPDECRKSFLNQFEELIQVLDEKCKRLKRLSLYIDELFRMESSDLPIEQLVDDLVALLYKSLTKNTKLANLDYLSFPIKSGSARYNSLVEFLRTRAQHGLPLRTLELSPRPDSDDADFKSEHLQRYVQHLIFSDTRFDSLYFDELYFPTAVL